MRKRMAWRVAGLGVTASAVWALAAAPALAQEPDVQTILDNIWVFVAGILVFLMQAGFGLVEAGLTRAKNVSNIMAKNLADMSVGAVAFFIVGFGLAYGSDAGSIIGTDSFLLAGGSGDLVNDSIYTDFFFQVVFAATAVTIASGAMAERTKFSGYLLFSVAMTALIYPVVVHWFWQGDGWISDLAIGDAKFGDFAGSTIVHSTGGWAALMGAYFLGPRIGKYDDQGRPKAILGHNIGLRSRRRVHPLVWLVWVQPWLRTCRRRGCHARRRHHDAVRRGWWIGRRGSYLVANQEDGCSDGRKRSAGRLGRHNGGYRHHVARRGSRSPV